MSSAKTSDMPVSGSEDPPGTPRSPGFTAAESSRREIATCFSDAGQSDGPDAGEPSRPRLDPGSRDRMGPHLLEFFQGSTLFDRIARTVCEAQCLPRKELYESWEVARRTRRRFRGGRVVDLCCGHGLVAHLMLLLDSTSNEAIAVDHAIPASAARLSSVLVAEWPRLNGRVRLVSGDLSEVQLRSTDIVVSAHACGTLSDRILEMAARASARVAILPCCHEAEVSDQGGLAGWLDSSLAIDVTRARRLATEGYTIYTQTIPACITPQNRLLLGVPNTGRTGS